MSKGKFAKNAGMLMLMELGIRGMDALVVFILARYLAPEGFGLLAFALAFSGLFGILPGFGMGALTIRNVARAPDQLNRFLINGLIVKLMLAGITLAIIGLGSRLFGHSPERQWIVMLAGVLMILETNVDFILSFFQAMEKMGTVAAVSLAVRVGWVVSSIAVMLFRGGIVELLEVRIAVTVLGLLVSLGLTHFRLQRLSWNFDPVFSWNILRDSLPFALFRVWMQLYGDTDTVMLSTMRGDVVTSFYVAAQKILRVFAFIPSGFGAANLPEMSRSSKQSHSALTRMIARRCKYLMIISLAISGMTFVIADWLVVFLFGKAYQGAESVLRFAIWSMPFTFMNGTILSAIAAVNCEQAGSNRLFVGLLFSVLSNFVVIPFYGPMGAAATTALSRAFVFYLEMQLLREILPDLKLLCVRRLMLATILMIAAGWAGRAAGWPMAVIAASLAYGGTLILTQAVKPEEGTSLLKLFRLKGAD